MFIRDTLGADVLKVDIDPAWNITLSARAGYHFYPHKTRGEGFYLCVFRKREAPFTPFRAKAEKTRGSKTVDELGELQSWLQHPERWSIRQSDRFTEAYPTWHKELIDWLSTHFTCVSTGFGIGELRGKHVAPQHSLSMLKDFRKEAFPQVELSLEMALAFLRSEALILPDQPSGYLLMTYQGVPLGFVKNIGNHSNNLYPNEWRIRHK